MLPNKSPREVVAKLMDPLDQDQAKAMKELTDALGGDVGIDRAATKIKRTALIKASTALLLSQVTHPQLTPDQARAVGAIFDALYDTAFEAGTKHD